MPYYQSTYYSRIFRDFKEIDAVNYRRVIRFYEEKEEEIKRLLKRMEQYSKEGERLRDLVQPRPQGRVKKDW